MNVIKKHELYQTWENEKSRCNNRNHRYYNDYGGRGIKVSKEFLNFKIWLVHVESLPFYSKRIALKLTLDRINNNIGYERDNLRWASPYEQATNQRMQRNNTSGYTGIVWHKLSSKWQAEISINKKKIHLGIYYNKKDAILSRNNYIIKHKLPHKIQLLITKDTK